LKAKIKDLEPNPFRDMDKYPIDQEKIQSLINSIQETGFWNNILARKHPDKSDKLQIAYGHHRMIALQKHLGLEATIDISVKKLDDATMLRIMAEENNESYKTDVAIIDETIRVILEYLKSLPFLKRVVEKHRGQQTVFFKGLPIPPKKIDSLDGYKWSPLAKQISTWLGKNWPEMRVHEALNRQKLYELGELDNSVQELSQTAAAHFTRAVKKHRPTKEQQKKAIIKIKENQDFSKANVEYRVLDEKYKKVLVKKKKIECTFEDFLGKTVTKARSLKGSLKTFLYYRDKIDPEFYRTKLIELLKNLAFLDYYIQKFKTGGKPDESRVSTKQISRD